MKFKKYLGGLLISMVLCSMLTVTTFAADDITKNDSEIEIGQHITDNSDVGNEMSAQQSAKSPTISVSNQIIHVQETDSLIQITTTGVGNLGALEFDVTYESSALAQMAVRISQGSHCKTYVSGNKISYAFADANGIDVSKVCELAFVARASTPVTISNVKAWNANGQSVVLAVENGKVTLDTKIPLGDANGDYEIDIRDILRIQDFILGRSNPIQITNAADTNGDGEINVLDIVLIQNHILGRK